MVRYWNDPRTEGTDDHANDVVRAHEEMKREIEVLRAQLAVRDETIERLRAMLPPEARRREMIDLTAFEGHTPGPWAVRGAPSRSGGYVIDVADHILCPGHGGAVFLSDVVAVTDWSGTAEWDANARLIAAAPDLLAEVVRLREALRDLLEDTQHAGHNCGGTAENCPVIRARAVLNGEA